MSVMQHTFKRTPNPRIARFMYVLSKSTRLVLGIAKNTKIQINTDWGSVAAGLWRVTRYKIQTTRNNTVLKNC